MEIHENPTAIPNNQFGRHIRQFALFPVSHAMNLNPVPTIFHRDSFRDIAFGGKVLCGEKWIEIQPHKISRSLLFGV
jgi:hypothetical protein